MAACRRVYDSRHLQADCQEPGSAPEPYARSSSMGYLFSFINSVGGCRCLWGRGVNVTTTTAATTALVHSDPQTIRPPPSPAPWPENLQLYFREWLYVINQPIAITCGAQFSEKILCNCAKNCPPHYKNVIVDTLSRGILKSHFLQYTVVGIRGCQ